MTNPGQVVAERFDSDVEWDRLTPSEARLVRDANRVKAGQAVAALKAAGALMPEDAAELHREFGYRSTDAEEWETTARERYALLQEALSVLGRRHQRQVGPAPWRWETCRGCGGPWPCPEASLAEKIEKAIGGEG